MEKIPESKRDLRDLRDKFAMNAVNGYLSNPEIQFHSDSIMVSRAYRIADTMIEARK